MAQRSRILLVYFLSFVCLCFAKMVVYETCETNSDCKEGEFCYDFSHYCVPCTVCKSYNREISEWTKCPEEPLHCGGCLKGFYEEILTGGEKREMCHKIKAKPGTEDGHSHSGTGTHILLYVSCACAVVCMVGVTYVAIRHRHRRREVQANCSHEMNTFMAARESPPPYCPPDRVQLTACPPDRVQLTAATDRDQPTIEISAPLSDFMAVNVEAESLQKANPFRQPDYDAPEREETLNHNEPANNLDLNDEDTMPSFWTPNERSEVDNTSVPGNDSGIANESSNDGSDPPPRTSTVLTGGVTRLESVNLEGGSAAVSNVNANSNQITFNITHYAIFSGDNTVNGPSSRVNGNGGSMTNSSAAINTETTSGSSICVAESAPQFVPFRP